MSFPLPRLIPSTIFVLSTDGPRTRLRQREEREVEKQQMERDRQVQISRWMRTIDTDRRA